MTHENKPSSVVKVVLNDAKRGRPCLYGKPMTNAVRQRRYRMGKTGR